MSRPNHLTLEQKHAFVQLAGAAGTTFAETCRAFRISRQTGYKWQGYYRQAGAPGLLARSRWLRRRIQRRTRITSQVMATTVWASRHRVEVTAIQAGT
jgi:hypothetical protein